MNVTCPAVQNIRVSRSRGRLARPRPKFADVTTPSDPFEELDRELREKVAGEFRRTAEEDEHAARKSTLRKRDMSHVAYELLSRGDSIRVTIGSTTIRGVVTHARGNLATVTAADGREAHINLAGPIAIEVAERSTAGGRGREQYGPESFIARLRELELNEARVEVISMSDGDPPNGRIEAVGSDHVMLVGSSHHFVPIAWIGAVRRL